MTPPKKPEWFEIADNDNATSTRKVSKALPVIALGSALLIIGAGVVFAQSENEAPAAAIESSNNSSTQLPSTPAVAVSTEDAPAPIKSVHRVVSATVVTTPPVVSLPPQATGIQAPSGRGHSEERQESEGGEDD